MEASGGHSPDGEGLLHHDAAAIDTQERITSKPDDEIPEETIHRLFSATMSKFESEVGDIASLLDAKRTREGVEEVLRFGAKLDLIGQQIVELRRELRAIVRSFSPENKDVMRTMITFTHEAPYLHGIARLRWISQWVSTLRRMDPDLDCKVKSTMVRMKSEAYLSAIEKEVSGGERVAAEDGGDFSVEMDKKRFAAYRLCWERTWGNGYSFEDQTLLSPMQFTHCRPSCVPVDAVAGRALQIYSIKVSPKGLAWPLKVYGAVTARDSVDRQRNPLFLRTRNYCQTLTEKDPFLQLIGPVRAIVSMDTVYIETELKSNKGGSKSEDVTLASTVINSYNGDNLPTSLADNCFCAIELCFERLEQSVQATILTVVVKAKPGSLPFPYGGKVLCSSLPCSGIGDFAGIPSRQALVFDSVDGELIKERAGHLDLNRRVLSVQLGGELQFHIQRYSQSDSAETDAQVLVFKAKKWNISKDACLFDDGSKVEITIAWSLLPSKMLS